MRYNFCTLFDKNYLYRGLALYASLVEHCADFRLWILCMDNTAYSTLKKMDLENVTLISLREFEDKELLEVKSTRTAVEYCWTCTSSLLFYILRKHPELETLSYLDADLFFFSDPLPIYEEIGEKPIMIIPHRCSKDTKFLEKEHGIYNVSMLNFRNGQRALECLKWWRERCLEWCFSYLEDGKFGDQNYLNDWPQRFSGVHVLKHKGANLAPWNIKNYRIRLTENKILVDEDPLIFYHFHTLKIYPSLRFQLFSADFRIKKGTVNLIYKLYIAALKKAVRDVKDIVPEFNFGFSPEPNSYQKFKQGIKRKLKSIPLLYLIWYRFKNRLSSKKRKQ